MSRIPHIAIAVAMTAGSLAVVNPALAQDDAPTGDTEQTADHDFDLKQRCLRAIDRRHGDLARVQSRLDEGRALTGAHEATLDGIIDATEAGLSSLAVEIEADDNRAELALHCAEIATDYRVYLVVLPQAHLTVGADRVDAGVRHGRGLIEALDAAIEAAEQAGADVSEVIPLRDQAETHLDIAESSNAGVAAGALSVTPASYNDGAGEVILSTVRAALRTAHSELEAGAEDGAAALQALREALDAIGSDA